MSASPPPAESSGFLLPPAPIERIDDFLAAGGGRGLERALEVGAVATIETITAAGLRGRGGRGLPDRAEVAVGTGCRGGSALRRRQRRRRRTATFKDRTLMRRDPYRVVEGAAIAAFAVSAEAIYLATKRSFAPR